MALLLLSLTHVGFEHSWCYQFRQELIRFSWMSFDSLYVFGVYVDAQVDGLLVITEFEEDSLIGKWNSSRPSGDPLAEP